MKVNKNKRLKIKCDLGQSNMFERLFDRCLDFQPPSPVPSSNSTVQGNFLRGFMGVAVGIIGPPQQIMKLLQTTGYRDWETDRKSTRLNSSHSRASRMPSSA